VDGGICTALTEGQEKQVTASVCRIRLEPPDELTMLTDNWITSYDIKAILAVVQVIP
jgi:hypothetical protein